MDKEEILKNQIKAYNCIPLLFEMVKCLHHRELAFLRRGTEKEKRVAVRYLVAFNVSFLQRHLNWIGYKRKIFNAYQSVALLKDIPVFSYNLKERLNEEKYVEFGKNFEKHIIGYDLFLDFDGKDNFERCHQEAKKMKEILDECKVPYYVLNSSKKGFHFRIPAEYMPDPDLDALNDVVDNLAGIYNFFHLDKVVVDSRRLCKLPFSAVNDGSIALPLNDAMFLNFREEMVEFDNVIKHIHLKGRGLLLRKHNLSDEELKNNVLKFLYEYK